MTDRSLTRGTLLGVLAVLLLLTSSAAARVEITPLFGYRWGGTLDTDAGDLVVEAAPQFGLIVGYALGEQGQVELSYTTQTGQLVRRPPGGGADEPQFDIAIGYWQLGYLYAFRPPEGIQPFISFSLGAAHFDVIAPERDGSWAFSGSLGLGAKLFFSEHVGLRAEARINSTSLPTSNYFCSTEGGCYNIHSMYMHQGSLSLGVIFAF